MPSSLVASAPTANPAPQPEGAARPVLEVRGLCKEFLLYAHPVDRLKEALTGRSRHTRHAALADIGFTLFAGEALGIIGQNGAGKSTLLKLLAGVLEPDAGSIHRQGRIAGLLELGTGFDLDATGRENIALNARLLGLSEPEIAAITPQVVAFAELGSFIDMPVRSYSSGMVMRLGFSVAYHAQPAAFIVDEALSVGDARFQQKCFQKIAAFKAQGGALLFVSHDLTAVRQICDRVLVLDAGQKTFEGLPGAAVEHYYARIAGLQASGAGGLGDGGQTDGGQADGGQVHSAAQDGHGLAIDGALQTSGYGRRQVVIAQIDWESGDSRYSLRPNAAQAHAALALQVASGSKVRIGLHVSSQIAYAASLGILIRDRFGQDIFGVNTAMQNLDLQLAPGQTQRVEFTVTLAIAPGPYTLTVAVHSQTTHHDDCQHWWDNAVAFTVVGFAAAPFSGLCGLPFSIALPTGSGAGVII